MAVYYRKTQNEVLVGGCVEFKNRLFFWRGWQAGRVYYVSGVSPKNEEPERDGLSWISIENKMSEQIGVLVEPETFQIQKSVRFVGRAEDGFTETPANYYFGDNDD
jgi:hypothetical protein